MAITGGHIIEIRQDDKLRFVTTDCSVASMQLDKITQVVRQGDFLFVEEDSTIRSLFQSVTVTISCILPYNRQLEALLPDGRASHRVAAT